MASLLNICRVAAFNLGSRTTTTTTKLNTSKQNRCSASMNNHGCMKQKGTAYFLEHGANWKCYGSM